MGWTTTPPSLPSGSSYKSVASWNYTANKYSTAGTISIARLATNQVSIKFYLNTNTGSTSTFAPPGYMDFKVGNSTKSYGWGGTTSSQTAYWTGTLAAGTKIATAAGAHDNGSAFSHATYAEKEATGPAYVTTYTITYYANNGTTTSTTQTKTYGTSVNLYSCGWTYAHYTFVCWNTNSSGTGTDYSAGKTYSTEAGLTLYAKWERITYPVTYNGNGATGGSTADQTKNDGENLTLRANGFTRENYSFLHWNTAADDSGTEYAAGGTYSTEAALALFAIWKKNNIPLYVNVDNTIHQVEKAYVNVNNTIKECRVFANVGGQIKELK